jgi:hypothetical protein
MSKKYIFLKNPLIFHYKILLFEEKKYFLDFFTFVQNIKISVVVALSQISR